MIVLNVIISLLTWISLSSGDPVCTSSQCQKLATLLKKSMNESLNPCTDFYDYVCYNWAALNPRPLHERVWVTERAMDHRVMNQVKKLLEDTKNSKVAEIEDAKLLYKACMSLPFLEKSNAKTIKSIMANIGNWPMFFSKQQSLPQSLPWWKIDNQYSEISGESAFLNYGLWFDTKEHVIVVVVQRLFSPYGTLKRYLPWKHVEEKINYKAFLKTVIQNVAPTNPDPFKEQIIADLEEVIKFREELRQVVQDVGQGPFQRMTIRQYQQQYGTSTIDWLEKIRAMFKNSKDVFGEKIQETGPISIQTTYFEKLVPLLKRTPERIIVNHIHLYFAERHIQLNSEMETSLKQSVTDDAYPSGTVRYDIPRDQGCIENNNMREGIGKMYIGAYFSNKDKEIVEHMVEKTKKLLAQQISKSNWLNSETKKKLVGKVNEVEAVVGYPKWYNPSMKNVPRTQYDINPTAADAYFEELIKRLSIGAGYLQWPVYTPNAPYVIDYACTISMIGHELYHGFDIAAVQYDSGKSKPQYWSPNMTSEYQNQYMCFLRNSKMQENENLSKYQIPWTPNIPSTINEDLADAMGLNLAYQGFIENLKKEKNVCPTLPGFEKYDCTKLFFIAYANNMCGSLTPENEKRMILTDHHSLPRLRVNGPVANMKEFSTAFGCYKGDPMKKEKTCDLWQK